MKKQTPLENHRKSENCCSFGIYLPANKGYPTPIAGCDEQFNFLLSESDKLRKELEKLRVDVN